MRIRSVRLSMAVFVVAVGALASLPLAAAPSPQNQKESFTGFAINTNSGPKTAVVDFTIERWSTDAEREQLSDHRREQGSDPKLLSTLQKLESRRHPDADPLSRTALRAPEPLEGGRGSSWRPTGRSASGKSA